MTISISNAFVEQFADVVRHLAQQGDTRLRPHVYEVPLTGEAYNFDRLAESDAVEKTTSRTVTPFVDPVWSRRVVAPKTFQWADTIENADKVQMLIDPQSAYAQNGGMSMRRAIDDLIIAAATADATDGAGAPVALPAGQIIGTAGSATAGMTLDLITQVNEKFQANDVDPDEPKVFVISPTRVREMLNTPSLTSADYQSVKALSANGMIHNFMGFTFVLSNRLTLDTGAEPSEANFAFTRKGIGLAVNNDIFVRIAERPDLSHLIQVYMEFTMNATRVEDEHVVVCHLDQDYTAPT
jgi:hypothetical protein